MCSSDLWTTLVGVEREGRAEVGVIAQPFTDEEWWGTAEGAFHRVGGGSTRCRVSGRTHLAEARVATTDVRATPQGSFTEDEAQAFLRVAAECPVARFGMDAYAYGLLARGDLDLVIESGLQRYDVAALLPILRGAGAVVSSWSGGDPSGGGSILAASSPRLHAAACALLAG